MTDFSVLDLSPIVEGGDASRALAETTAYAQAADRLEEAGIDRHVRGWDKASDHVPVWCRLSG